MAPRSSPPQPLDDTRRVFAAGPDTLVESAGVRQAWHRGRSRYAVWIVRVDDPEVHARVAAAQRTLSAWIEPLGAEDLHITLAVAGFVAPRATANDDVTPTALAQQAALARTVGGPFVYRIGGLHSFLGAPFLAIEDVTGSLARLHGALTAPGCPLAPTRYLPHLTVGRYAGRFPTRDLLPALARPDEPPPRQRCFDEVELVTFAARTPHAPLVTRARIPLVPDR
ncbi:MAG: 2'-5' RNA ligase family protein [Myxococcales bacterium]|nr:2'-5' RNA ligase family protein [Myxococcales bacterium]